MRYFLELTEDETVSVELSGMAMVVSVTDGFIYLQSPGIQNERSRQDVREVSELQA